LAPCSTPRKRPSTSHAPSPMVISPSRATTPRSRPKPGSMGLRAAHLDAAGRAHLPGCAGRDVGANCGVGTLVDGLVRRLFTRGQWQRLGWRQRSGNSGRVRGQLHRSCPRWGRADLPGGTGNAEAPLHPVYRYGSGGRCQRHASEQRESGCGSDRESAEGRVDKLASGRQRGGQPTKGFAHAVECEHG
jgi:hypothetical protein